ncbi:MAG: DUF2461 domain-containing protein [Deltaproteobacteria bacterium]|nr:DUF2461 domain-containing protein [Deltaproteobacteria bacterium]
MIENFEGFSSATFQFLGNLCDNNHKAWFELHKPDYQDHVLRPMQALVSELGLFMLSIDPDIEVTPALNKTISRIYRDTRFSKDKSPYKTSHWITFKRLRKEWKDFPAFFFEISPNSYRYGMGFYDASRQTMDNFRESIDSDPRSFLSVISFYAGQEIFTIEGEEYKRPLKADIPKEFQAWYNRKNLYLICNRQIQGSGIDKKLISDLMHGFEIIAPFYHFLCEIAVRKMPNQRMEAEATIRGLARKR